MNTTLISLSIKNLNQFDDENKIRDYLKKIDKIENVTVNIVDRNVIVSGNEINQKEIIDLLKEIGFEAE